jgi:hypothetical protein
VITGLASPDQVSLDLRRHVTCDKASGHSRVVLARFARNRRLGDACDQWAFCALTHSPGARSYYDQLRARGKTHRQALRQLADRLVGILHVCIQREILYDELAAWPEDSLLLLDSCAGGMSSSPTSEPNRGISLMTRRPYRRTCRRAMQNFRLQTRSHQRVVRIPPKALASWWAPVRLVRARVGRGDDGPEVRGEDLPCSRLFGSSKTNPHLARSCR